MNDNKLVVIICTAVRRWRGGWPVEAAAAAMWGVEVACLTPWEFSRNSCCGPYISGILLVLWTSTIATGEMEGRM